MANNRMWLINERLGQRILLAKYYPSTGWYTFHTDIQERLDLMFEEEMEEALAFGQTDWTLEYEHAE